MGLLQRLGHDIAQRKIEIGAVVFAAAILEHRDHCTYRIFPDRAFFVEAAVERFEFGDAGALAHAELDAAATDQIERRDALGDARGMDRRQLHDAVRKADLPGALARRGEAHLRCRRVRIFLEERVLDFPGEVVAEPVRQLELVEGVMVESELCLRFPGPRQLQLVEYAEFHSCLPRSCVQPMVWRRKLYPRAVKEERSLFSLPYP